jgi:hypothetical protein
MKRMKKPNIKGPRFREKRISVLTTDTFNAFKKKNPAYEDMSLQEFKEIIMTFNGLVVEGIIDTRNGVNLPEGLGHIFMATCPTPKKKNIDFKKSFDYGVEATHRNWDSDNNLLKIFYTNYSTKRSFQNKHLWVFKAVKQFRKKASDAYKDDWTKYIKVEPRMKISAIFNKYRKKEYAINNKMTIPENYDEFKL